MVMDVIASAQVIRKRPLWGFAIAALLTFLAFLLRIIFGASLDQSPYLAFLAAVGLATLVGGRGTGIFATVLAALLAQCFHGSSLSWPTWPDEWVPLFVFALTAAAIIAVIHVMQSAHEIRRQSETALQRMNEELEQRVAERTAALQTEISEHTAAQAQLRQMQKMESIGQLTGGIAHDFNNMLAIIMGSLDIARRRLKGDEHPKVAECLDHASEGARRAADLTARLLAFSRQQALEPQALNLNKLVGNMSEMLRRTLGEHIRIETVLAGGLWHAFADAGQLENAIVNLAVNARDAMEGGGRLTIETANADLDDRYALLHDEVAPGQYVLVSISDTGTGMPVEVIERAFEPFFTTKGVGKGTGLGLSQVFGYIKQSGGHVKIYSEIGQGTTIKLYLPRHLGASVPPEGAGDRAILPFAAEGQNNILVVEDDDEVRRMTVAALEELGYKILEASSARQALDIVKEGHAIDLLFTDIVMPEMNGRELADQARALKPDLRVLFTTGYTRNAVVHNGMLDAGVVLLSKPFTLEQLALKVRSLLTPAAG
ncbi:MAG: response regulator [Sphingobium sp.]|uniref:response regulator n=1 Tax=Sphingobium sp. TaxID=1912891 RepID=UPI0029BDB90A|nr:response regulator [Sphingobium sp.]MDX3910946.1 response regulator [Sphingobium sp.]